MTSRIQILTSDDV